MSPPPPADSAESISSDLASSSTIARWDVEDQAFWVSCGRRIANRNLVISVIALLLGMAVWTLMSTIVVNLPGIGFAFSKSQLFHLTALAGLAGATLRIFYSFIVPIFGGRNWTVLSTFSLLLPCIGLGIAVQHPQAPYWVFVILALLCGTGGGNFASSMANISFFFPKARKGTALGINAGLGNLGVSAMQFFAPLVLGFALFASLGGPQAWKEGEVSRRIYLQNAAFVWVPFIVITALLAWWGMNNLAVAQGGFREQAIIFRRKHNWLMCLLYTGTFGSYIGFSQGLPLLIKTQFPTVPPLKYAFLAALLGAVIRPLGGWLSDKLGGARVTLWVFVGMIAAAVGVIVSIDASSFPTFLVTILVLALATGIGNGSTFRMIPVIFLTEHQRRSADAPPEVQSDVAKQAARESAAVLGFSSAIGAYGAFVIPQALGWSIESTRSPVRAIFGVIAFYIGCLAVTWWCYARRHANTPC